MTHDELIKTGWVCTDPDTKQYRLEITPNIEYEFREERLLHPERKTTYIYYSTMNINNYSGTEVLRACAAFGYHPGDVVHWALKRLNIPLILECLFEMETD